MTNKLTPSGELVLEQLGINPHNLSADFPTREQRLQYRAVVQWLTDYKPKLDATNLEKVRGYLETFYHLCKVEDWQRAKAVICCQLDTPTQEKLHHQLGTWGYYQERIDLYSRLLYNLNSYWDSICLNGLGNAYDSLGEYVRAIEYHQQDLAIAQEISDKTGEEAALGNLGIAYHALGDYTRAIEYHQQSLVIAQEISNKAGEGKAIGNLGIAYHDLGDYARALEFYQPSLVIARKIGDRQREGVIVGNLGQTLTKLGQYSEALENLQAALEIGREISVPYIDAVIIYCHRIRHSFSKRM